MDIIKPIKLRKKECPYCRIVPQPGKRSHYCGTCRQCIRICNCRKRADCNKFPIPQANSLAPGSSSWVLKSRRAIGLEIELATFGTWAVAKKQAGVIPDGPGYMIDHDGSVRPSQMEAVVKPMAGDQEIVNGLVAIAQHVYNNNCTVNETCGYHVHVDARDYNWADIQKLMMIWMNVEDHLAIWNLAGRQPNDHCQRWTTWWSKYHGKISPAGDLAVFKRNVIVALYEHDIAQLETNIANMKLHGATYKRALNLHYDAPRDYRKPRAVDYLPGWKRHMELKANRGWNHAVPSRYLDLNIHSWLYRGTIEYRLGAGTVDPTDIQMWPLWCLWFTEAVLRSNYTLLKANYTDRKFDPIVKMTRDGGIIIPSIQGEQIYPMPGFLRNWVQSKIYAKDKL